MLFGPLWQKKSVMWWCPQTEQLHLKMTHSQEDSLTAVSWGAASDKFVCGGARGQFYHCSLDVTIYAKCLGYFAKVEQYKLHLGRLSCFCVQRE